MRASKTRRWLPCARSSRGCPTRRSPRARTAASSSPTRWPASCSATRPRSWSPPRAGAVARARARALPAQHAALLRHRASAALLDRGVGAAADGSEFVGEMSWGIVETAMGPLLLAIGRDVSERRASERRLRAVAAIGERALAGAGLHELATDAVEQLRHTLPLARAELRVPGGEVLVFGGDPVGAGLRLELGAEDEFVTWFKREISDEETSFVRAVATILGTALARLRSDERVRYEALHDALTGLANRTLLRDRIGALATARAEEPAAAVRPAARPRRVQDDQRPLRPRRRRRVLVEVGDADPAPSSARRHRGATRRRRVRRRLRGDRRGHRAGARRAPRRGDPAPAARWPAASTV